MPSGIELQIKFTARKRYAYPDGMRRNVCRGTKVSSKTQRATQHWGDSFPQKVWFLEAFCFQLVFQICITYKKDFRCSSSSCYHEAFCHLLCSSWCLLSLCLLYLETEIQTNTAHLVMASVTQVDELQQPLSLLLFPIYLVAVDAYLCEDPVLWGWFQERQIIYCFFYAV